MLSSSAIFAILLFALILLFFTNLPNLRTCRLPTRDSSRHDPEEAIRLSGAPAGGSPASRTEISRSGAQGAGDRRAEWGVLAVTVLYAVSAFWNLGNLRSPQTFVPMAGSSAVMDFKAPAKPAMLVLFPGVGQGKYSIEVSDDMEGWFPVKTFTQDHVSVLKWQYITLGITDSRRYLRIHCTSGAPWLGEIRLLDIYDEALPGDCTLPELTDEQNTVPERSDFRNSSYFDEIYHARTAWENLHGVWPYEISHPPLGKELLSLGILLFGMTPFGWRFSGTLTGVLMLPLMYLFLRRLFSGKRIPFLGTILLAAGFMHYAQTRIATIDSYSVFFILLMYYFMLRWLQDGRRLDLLLCGTAFGLGAATKWICLYAGAGLFVLWLTHWVGEFRRGTSVPTFLKHGLSCVLCFLLIPAVIYYLSYLPYGVAEGTVPGNPAYTKIVLDNQSFMLSYHVNVQAEHPYSSRWWQWILDLRPILYYLEYFDDGSRVSLACFVNPLLCWAGLLSLAVLLICAVSRRDRMAAILLVCWASGLIPWIFIRRLTFEYHYFASALFLIPAICYVFSLMEDNTRYGRIFTTGFTVLAAVLFVWFFPALNGIRIDNSLGTKLLGWLPGWPI